MVNKAASLAKAAAAGAKGTPKAYDASRGGGVPQLLTTPKGYNADADVVAPAANGASDKKEKKKKKRDKEARGARAADARGARQACGADTHALLIRRQRTGTLPTATRRRSPRKRRSATRRRRSDHRSVAVSH